MRHDRPNLVVLADEAALAEAVARHFVDLASQAIALRGRFEVALAGGSTPKAANALLASAPLREHVTWSKVRFFFGDERCVPPDDDQSNYKSARETLLEPLSIDEAQVFRMRGEDDPQTAADTYAEVLRRELGEKPSFDLVMLGMGPDGHTASLFPGTDPLSDDDRLVRAPWVAKLSSYRITLTPRVINGACNVAIATEGSAKAEALAQALEGPYDPAVIPIQIVRPSNGALVWFVDGTAAGRLTIV